MEKKSIDHCRRRKFMQCKPSLAMRLTFFIMIFFMLQTSAKSFSQNVKVSLDVNEETLSSVFEDISSQTDYDFFYSSIFLDVNKKITVKAENVALSKVMQKILGADYDVEYKSNLVIITPKEKQIEQEEKLLKGIIKDKTGVPLPGVSVFIKGTTIGTSTDIDGMYSLNVSDAKNKMIEFSFIGMKTQVITYKGQSVLNIVLVEDAETMDEVVVTGFQTISKERATGAYAKVGEEFLSKKPVSDITSAISSLAPGVANDMDENGNINIVIRGQGSLSGSSNPLIVVDGFPIEGDLSSINPTDIKEITVLKDAASTSIYGARAANGVIVVTTKKASSEKVSVSYSGFVKIADKYDLDYSLHMLDSKAQIEREQALVNAGMVSPIPTDGKWRNNYSQSQSMLIENMFGRGLSDSELEQRLNVLKKQDYKDDYNKYLLRNAVKQQHNFSIQGKADKNSFRLSAMFDNDLTGYKYNNIDKYMVSLKNIYKINDKISYTFNTSISSVNTKMNGTDFGEIRRVTTPYQKLVDDNGNYVNMPNGYYMPYREYMQDRMPYKNWGYNILEEARNRDNNFDQLAIRIQNRFDYEILKGLKLSTQFQYESTKNHWKNYMSEKSFFVRNNVNSFSTNMTDKGGTTYDYSPNGFDKGGILVERNTTNTTYNFRSQIEFNKDIAPKHNISLLAGTEIISSESIQPSQRQIMGYDPESFTGESFDFTKELTYHNKDQGLSTVGEVFGYGSNFRNEYRRYNRYFSTYFNAAYSYDNKYTASLSLRTDASNFVSKNVSDKFSPFWSVGSMWNIHREDFIADSYDWINRLSLRASYGVVGLPAARQNLSTLTTLGYGVTTTYGGNIPYANVASYGLSNLTWEKSYTFNIGLDFSLFNNAIYGSLEFYNKKSVDVISRKSVAAMVNPTKQLHGNFSDILNRGVEVQIGSDLKITDDFSWNGVLNMSYNYNEVLSFDDKSPIVSTYRYDYGNPYQNTGYHIEGKPIDYLNTYKWLGLNDKGYGMIEVNGKTIVLDQLVSSNDVNSIDNTNQNIYDFLQYEGRKTPIVFSSFISSFKYKNFDLSFTISGKFGHKFMMSGIQSGNLSPNSFSASKTIDQAWSDSNKDTSTPIANPQSSDTDLYKTYGGNSAIYYNASSDLVRDASHIRLDEIYLGYNLSKSLLSKLHISSVTLFGQMKNCGLLWTANNDGIDPDYLPRVINVVKPPKTYTLGLKINF